MTDPTGRIRAKKLAEELNALWKKPTTTQSLRLPVRVRTRQRTAKPDEAEEQRGGRSDRRSTRPPTWKTFSAPRDR
jgi:hypothetical protein